jgi:myo-inositol catabolism protein IolH
VHLADTVHPGRIIVNPPDARVSVHQHLDLGEGEVDLDGLFAALAATRFDGVLTTSVFFQDERATASFAHNLATVRRLARAAGLALAETGSDDDG